MSAVISITFTDDDVVSMAENADVPVDVARQRADSWARHIADTASTLISEQLASVIENDTP